MERDSGDTEACNAINLLFGFDLSLTSEITPRKGAAPHKPLHFNRCSLLDDIDGTLINV